MLKQLLIGGVTLATVGYGIKVYCEEEGCSFFDEDDSSVEECQVAPMRQSVLSEDSAMNYYHYKVSLYESSIAAFQALYNQLENCSIRIVKPNSIEFELEEIAEGSADAEKITKRIRKYGKLLDKVDQLLSSELYTLRSIIEVNPDYSTFTEEKEQATVQTAYKLAQMMATLCHEKIVAEEGTVTKGSKELLKSQREIVNSIFEQRNNE